MAGRVTHGKRRGAAARSGPSFPESRNRAKVVSVRLAPEIRSALDGLAARWGLSRSAAIAKLVQDAAGGESSP